MEQTGLQTVPAASAGGPANIEQINPSSGSAELVLTRQDLLEELARLQDVVSRKTTVPILSNVLMQADGQVLLLTATDLDVSLRTSCPARVKKPGAFTMPARKLYDYVRLLPEGEITIKVLENDWVQLKSGRSHTKMVGLARKNFPTLPLFPRQSALTLPADVLRTVISRTMFAISKEESRYTLNGALLAIKPMGTTMVATDGHRLAHIEYPKLTNAIEKELRVLIPQKALAQIHFLLASDPVEQVGFAQDDSTLFFAIGKRLLSSRQLSGRFPNYEAVLPRDNPHKLTVKSVEFSDAIRRVAQFSDERSSAVRLRIEKDQLLVSSSSADAGESEDTIQTTYSGDAISIAFNSHYLLDFLKVAAASSDLELQLKDAQTAAELKPDNAGQSDCTYRYIVMPLRI
jgi:DNA polymerase-3 subunit beta